MASALNETGIASCKCDGHPMLNSNITGHAISHGAGVVTSSRRGLQ